MANVIQVDDLQPGTAARLLQRFGLQLVVVASEEPIPASFWGDSEAGLQGRTVFLRGDTPVHSFLHETCHLVCMDEARRRNLDRDAGGSDLEESAVCYLQILLADELPGIGRERLMQDMDAWGYSFRLGSTAAWFASDADDARDWLARNGLITADDRPCWRLRTD
jgi:hypothetical protein